MLTLEVSLISSLQLTMSFEKCTVHFNLCHYEEAISGGCIHVFLSERNRDDKVGLFLSLFLAPH